MSLALKAMALALRVLVLGLEGPDLDYKIYKHVIFFWDKCDEMCMYVFIQCSNPTVLMKYNSNTTVHLFRSAKYVI
jgi:hypothetical protein